MVKSWHPRNLKPVKIFSKATLFFLLLPFSVYVTVRGRFRFFGRVLAEVKTDVILIFHGDQAQTTPFFTY